MKLIIFSLLFVGSTFAADSKANISLAGFKRLLNTTVEAMEAMDAQSLIPSAINVAYAISDEFHNIIDAVCFVIEKLPILFSIVPIFFKILPKLLALLPAIIKSLAAVFYILKIFVVKLPEILQALLAAVEELPSLLIAFPGGIKALLEIFKNLPELANNMGALGKVTSTLKL